MSTRATGGQYFCSFSDGKRERGELARVGVRPFAAGDRGRGMRRVFERIVLAIQTAVFDRADFVADLDHRVDEAIEFVLRLAFGRFDHQRAGDRETQRRRMETEIDQPLGHVFGTDAGRVFDRTKIENAFVRDETVTTGVQRAVMRREALSDVVRIE